MTTMPMTVAALILAAGKSSRMRRSRARGAHDEGANKLLAPVGGGPMIARIAEAALASRARPVVVVTGFESDRVAAALADLAVKIVPNPDYGLGLSASLKTGLAALKDTGVAGALVLLGDMPHLTAATLDRLIAAFGGKRRERDLRARGRRPARKSSAVARRSIRRNVRARGRQGCA